MFVTLDWTVEVISISIDAKTVRCFNDFYRVSVRRNVSRYTCVSYCSYSVTRVINVLLELEQLEHLV